MWKKNKRKHASNGPEDLRFFFSLHVCHALAGQWRISKPSDRVGWHAAWLLVENKKSRALSETVQATCLTSVIHVIFYNEQCWLTAKPLPTTNTIIYGTFSDAVHRFLAASLMPGHYTATVRLCVHMFGECIAVYRRSHFWQNRTKKSRPCTDFGRGQVQITDDMRQNRFPAMITSANTFRCSATISLTSRLHVSTTTDFYFIPEFRII